MRISLAAGSRADDAQVIAPLSVAFKTTTAASAMAASPAIKSGMPSRSAVLKNAGPLGTVNLALSPSSASLKQKRVWSLAEPHRKLQEAG